MCLESMVRHGCQIKTQTNEKWAEINEDHRRSLVSPPLTERQLTFYVDGSKVRTFAPSDHRSFIPSYESDSSTECTLSALRFVHNMCEEGRKNAFARITAKIITGMDDAEHHERRHQSTAIHQAGLVCSILRNLKSTRFFPRGGRDDGDFWLARPTSTARGLKE
ncbi:hypothetical protein I7I51_06389 [Histoplasma capsulatum]|uniref:Uncharacterized protein n=1 Tax=Ajellomyces capsulatus TaxID=5037 RepID=A0A8A1MI46_AJECA|nr:hypothetical protein I7I51_06389 [Histoplasma capsulatum]